MSEGLVFDFEKLKVDQKARETNKQPFKFIYSTKALDFNIADQWKRAGLNMLLNLAEGVGRMTAAD